MKLPQGFSTAGISAGLKRSGRRDLGMIRGDAPLNWAMVGTTNVVHSACVARNRELHEAGQPVQALIINSGNANTATGRQGEEDNRHMAEALAGQLGLADSSAALTASTGVVGRRMPIDAITEAVPQLEENLSDDSSAFAVSILTTDLVFKQEETELLSGARIVGVAKGSGMIHPSMATMLAFVMTDAKVSQEQLRALWQETAAVTFNQITVDGDTSPNDMAFAFSSNLVDTDLAELGAGLRRVAEGLARRIARDGEGATRLVTVEVRGARDDTEARQAARTVAGSPLVKAAVHGNDPNWGRIIVALGHSGAVFDPARARVDMQGVTVYDGMPREFDSLATSELLKQDEVLIAVDLGAGDGRGSAWGCDLTAEYVRINADYTT